MPDRYLLALATMKSGPPSVDEVEYLRARYATIVCGACSFALMLAFPLVLRRRVEKLRRADSLQLSEDRVEQSGFEQLMTLERGEPRSPEITRE